MSRLIEIEGLTKRYGARRAINDISLSLDKGGIIGLVGKNGAGKTTLLSMLAGALAPTSGSVRILGHPASAPALLGKINILLQDANFTNGIPVNKQLVHFARLQGMNKTAAREEVTRLLARLSNAAYAEKAPAAMSHGQRKQLGIMQSLIGAPALILLDEPTAGLDPVAAGAIRRMIQDLAERSTFIISSHNLYELEDICTRILVLDDGRLKMNTTLAALGRASNCIHVTLDGSASEALLSALSRLPGIIEVNVDQAAAEKIALHFAGPEVDKLQLQIQGLVIEHGYSALQLGRGENMLGSLLSDLTEGT